MNWYIQKNDYLMHYGTKGQKWGIRRYQNPDGTLTPEGKERYGKMSSVTKMGKYSSKLYQENRRLYLKRKISKDQYKSNKKEIKETYKNALAENSKKLMINDAIKSGAKIGTSIGLSEYGKHVTNNATKMLKDRTGTDITQEASDFKKEITKMGTVSVGKTLLKGGINALIIGRAKKDTGQLKEGQKIAPETIIGAVEIASAATALGSVYAPRVINKINANKPPKMSSYEKGQQKGEYGSYEEVPDEPYGYLEKRDD